MYTSDAQFGFKASHGTDMAIFSFKESVKIYLNSGSPVFACFLDATKAFDRVNHTKLFNILKTRKIPEYLIGILSYWYSNQKYAVRWGNAISSYFEISNGIRQGGVSEIIRKDDTTANKSYQQNVVMFSNALVV